MNRLSRFAIGLSFAAAAAFCVAAVAQDQGQDPSQDQDPAAVNVAPSGPSYTTEAPPPQAQEQQGAPAPGPDDQDYAEQPTETAPQPPPALPDYQQPPPPGDGYIWTPGYWAWAPSGYYWVPGAWVEPPYASALWTPGYWGFYGGRYMFYPGHWGLHIGFYGGINYGFGYVGFGYEGGYWRGGHFFYNRVYNHIDARVHNVYSYSARVNVARGNARASYRGGMGGVQARPRPSERSRLARTNCPAHEFAGAARAKLLQGSGPICGPESWPAGADRLCGSRCRADHNVKPQSHGGDSQQRR